VWGRVLGAGRAVHVRLDEHDVLCQRVRVLGHSRGNHFWRDMGILAVATLALGWVDVSRIHFSASFEAGVRFAPCVPTLAS